ncbi:MAG: transketolase C-terminal domain-containing protein [Acidobacteriota bacterium]
MTELAGQHPQILLMTGDLGYMAIEPFADAFPERFFNAGVAEQNMVGMATGLAEAGYIPFTYSIGTFASLRPFEFFRNGAILHQLPVRVAGVGGGFEYGSAGLTHFGLEDVGVLRTQPGLTLVAPADHQQARTALLQTWNQPGPVYYRLGKDDRSVVPGLDGRFELGRAQMVRDGSDVLLLAMGSIAGEAVRAAELLEKDGVQATVIVVASLTPAPHADLARALSGFPVALTVEAHYLVGGLGSLVSEVAAGLGVSCRVIRCGVQGSDDGRTGSQEFLHRQHGLSAEALAATALRALGRKRA